MKQLFLLVSLLLTGVIRIIAQTYADPSEFLLDGYQEAIVLYKDGKQFQVPVNYNLLDKRFLFLDPRSNNQPMEFGEIDMISAIRIENRVFIYLIKKR